MSFVPVCLSGLILAFSLPQGPLSRTATETGASKRSIPGTGTLTGTITFAGELPAELGIKPDSDQEFCGAHDIKSQTLLVDKDTRGLRNVFVEIPGERSKHDGKKKYVLNQRGCVFTPHLLAVPRGAVVHFKNSDGILHNVRAKPRLNRAFNLAIPANRSAKKKFRRPEKIKILCDVHKWMSSWVIVAKSRFHAVTNGKGSFRIEGLPAGKHGISFWHETLGKRKASVEIRPGETSKLDLEFKRPGATPEPGDG